MITHPPEKKKAQIGHILPRLFLYLQLLFIRLLNVFFFVPEEIEKEKARNEYR